MTEVKQIADLAWVDEFIENVRPYIFVRLEDNLLIKRPNSAQKLNPMGARILKSLTDGMKIHALLDRIGRDPARIADVGNFFRAVKARLEGRLDPFTDNPAVAVAPFEMRFSDYPVLSEVAVTYHCNLKCAFCYAGCGGAKHADSRGREMTARQIRRVLAKIFHQAKVPSVSFTGGEPTLTRANAEDCLNLPWFVREVLKNDKFSMNLMIPAGSGAVHDELIVPYSRAGEWITNVMDRSREAGVEFMWYSPVPMCLFNSVAHGLGNRGCAACDGLVSVAPNGDVLPCSSWAEPVGNLLKEDFAAIWTTARAKKCRDKGFAHPACRDCPDFYICHGACPLYWQKIGFAELEREKDIEYKGSGVRCQTVRPYSGGLIP